MNKTLQEKLDSLEGLIGVQRDSLERGYMHGMLNGLICAHAIFSDSSPQYARVSHRKPNRINIRHKSRQVKLKNK
jgi:hypothetical protein